MKSFLSDYLVIFQNLTLPGFFYLLGALILIKTYTNIKIDERIKDNKELLFFVSILVVVFSFIIGLTVYLAQQELKSLIFKTLDAKKLKPTSDVGNYYNNVYCVLIMIRNLIFSISFLVVSIAICFKREGKRLNNRGFFIIMYFILFSVLSLAYLKTKSLLDIANAGKPICMIWILVGIIIPFSISLFSIYIVNTRKIGK